MRDSFEDILTGEYACEGYHGKQTITCKLHRTNWSQCVDFNGHKFGYILGGLMIATSLYLY